VWIANPSLHGSCIRCSLTVIWHIRNLSYVIRELLRERLKNVMKPEAPRLFVFNHCRQFIRTVPVPPCDDIDMDDMDSAAEDHVGEDTEAADLPGGQSLLQAQPPSGL